MIECPCKNCRKRYKKANYWYENHLLIKHGLVNQTSIKYWVITFLIAFIAGGLVYFSFYAKPSWFDLVRGPQLRIDFYNELKNIERKPSIAMDLTNEGGIDLHNIKANLNIACHTGYNKDKIDYGTETFEKPSYHIPANSEPKQIYFRNDRLITRIKNQEGVSCADSIFIIVIYPLVNETPENLTKVFIFEYTEKNKSVTSKTLQDYKRFKVSLCWHCEYVLTILSDEKRFVERINKTHSFISNYVDINSEPPLPELTAESNTVINYFYIGNGKISCINCVIDQLDKKYPELSIKKQWNLSEKGLTNTECPVGQGTFSLDDCKS